MPELDEVLETLRAEGYTVTARIPEETFRGFVGPQPGGSFTIPYMVELTIERPEPPDSEE